MQDARTPITVSLVTIARTSVLNLCAERDDGVPGLALGTAIAANINAGLLLVLLSKRIGGVDAPRIWWSLFKISVASTAMAVVAYFGESWLRSVWPGGGELTRGIRVFATIAASMGTLAVAAWILRIEEFRVAIERVRGRAGI